MSDAAGSYRINAAPAGQLRLVVDAQGYVGAQGNASIAPAQTSISAVDFSLIPAGSVTAVGNPDVPRDFALRQNYPNPFNPSTTIDYSLPVESIVHLTVYNLLGQEVATLMNGLVSVGKHQAVWNGKDNAGHQVASGIYFYRMNATPTAGGAAFSSIFKMVLLK